MTKRILIASLALAAGVAFAQGPGGGNVQLSPAAKAKMDALRKWRDNHKNVTTLQGTIRGLNELTKDPKYKFTPTQAKTILGVINKWKDKKSVTDAQAHDINTALTKPLTNAQVKAMVRSMPNFGRGRGGGGGGGNFGGFGGGGGGGQRGGGGGGRTFDASKIPTPRDYNPLNPSTAMSDRQKERMKTDMSNLVSKLKAASH